MKILPYLLCFLPVSLHAQVDTTYNGIKFEQTLSWEEIKAKAKTSNKYIFVDCYATWCGPCKMMDREVYSDPQVGKAFNKQFISVKVQMDSTAKDEEQTKKWYTTAQKMRHDYKIQAFPTYLFFTPNTELVLKEMGFMTANNFIRLINLAKDPQKPLYYAQYQQYKQNIKEYETMGKLALFTRDVIGDNDLSDKMSKDYKKYYLDKLDPEVLYTKEHIDFICNFIPLVSIKDKFFLLCYNNPARFDSISGTTGLGNDIVVQTITREEIAAKVQKKSKPISKSPNWDELETYIAEKYSSIDAHKLVLDYKIRYYRDIDKDWTLWAKYKDEMIKKYPFKPPYGLEVYISINGHGGAWHAFLHCSDSAVLTKALEWVELAITLDGEDTPRLAAYMDTKANLLYKLGQKEKALKLQKEAVELLIGVKDSRLLDKYAKMQRGEPTWDTTAQ